MATQALGANPLETFSLQELCVGWVICRHYATIRRRFSEVFVVIPFHFHSHLPPTRVLEHFVREIEIINYQSNESRNRRNVWLPS
jgi:hypothetical protein